VSLDWLLLGKGKPGAIGGPINNDLFSLVFNQLHAALDQMALDNFPWPHFVANVAAIYNEALLREVEGASASALVTALVCRRVGDLAGAMASTMKSNRSKDAAEIERLQRMERDYEAQAKAAWPLNPRSARRR